MRLVLKLKSGNPFNKQNITTTTNKEKQSNVFAFSLISQAADYSQNYTTLNILVPGQTFFFS